VLYEFIMPGFFIRPEWWNWAMFIVIPLLLILLAVAGWSIISGVYGLFRSAGSPVVDKRKIPDIMAFLKEKLPKRTERPLQPHR
jgi:hypothetical protein